MHIGLGIVYCMDVCFLNITDSKRHSKVKKNYVNLFTPGTVLFILSLDCSEMRYFTIFDRNIVKPCVKGLNTIGKNVCKCIHTFFKQIKFQFIFFCH